METKSPKHICEIPVCKKGCKVQKSPKYQGILQSFEKQYARSLFSKKYDRKSETEEKFKSSFQNETHIGQYPYNAPIFNFGDKRSTFKIKDQPQDYYELRKHHLEQKTLFEDPIFPANYWTLFQFPNRKEPQLDVKWLRPREIVNNPIFFLSDSSKEGSVGDSWFLSALAALTTCPTLFEFVVPLDQKFDEFYAGIFHFRFWQFGSWIDVVIDDRLPILDDKFLFVSSIRQNEFWSVLLGKAFAKLHFSYESIDYSLVTDLFEDLTGGLGEFFSLRPSPENLFQILLKADERMSLMVCSSTPDGDEYETVTNEGLIEGHVYNITKVLCFESVEEKTLLVRLRNSWGRSTWNGAWSNCSPEWMKLSGNASKLGLTIEDNGDFWMNFNDFLLHFDSLIICHLPPNILNDNTLLNKKKKNWYLSTFEEEWVIGVNAGGSINFKETFAGNPQFQITLTEADDGDAEGNCTLIISLLNKDIRKLVDMLIYVFIIDNPETAPKPLNFKCLEGNCVSFTEPIVARGTFLRTKLLPGTYCIIPCTFDPNEEVPFLLRVFSEKKLEMREYDYDVNFLGVTDEIIDGVRGELSLARDTQDMSRLETAAFRSIAGRDEAIDWRELQNILKSHMVGVTGFSGFTTEMCRALIAIFDIDHSGQLKYEEYKELMKQLFMWIYVWRQYDRDRSGNMDATELREALFDSGIQISNKILNILIHRYGDRRGRIALEDFIMCVIKLKTMLEKFDLKKEDNVISLNMTEWLQIVLYN